VSVRKEALTAVEGHVVHIGRHRYPVCREQRGLGGCRVLAGCVCAVGGILGLAWHVGHRRVGSTFLRCGGRRVGSAEERAGRFRGFGVRVGARGNLRGVLEAVLWGSCDQYTLRMQCMLLCMRGCGALTPSFSELCELVGLSFFSSAEPESAMVTVRCAKVRVQGAVGMGQMSSL
jgi:hypothetical protein